MASLTTILLIAHLSPAGVRNARRLAVNEKPLEVFRLMSRYEGKAGNILTPCMKVCTGADEDQECSFGLSQGCFPIPVSQGITAFFSHVQMARMHMSSASIKKPIPAIPAIARLVGQAKTHVHELKCTDIGGAPRRSKHQSRRPYWRTHRFRTCHSKESSKAGP